MQTTTKVGIPESSIKIKCDDHILSLGSCFSDNIGKKLQEHHFVCKSNPFGTLFDPISIARILEDGIDKKEVDTSRIVQRNDVFFHYDYHSSVYGMSSDELINNIEAKRDEMHEFLHKTEWLIITLGTSIVYELKSTNHSVANCHKMPMLGFKRRILSAEEIKMRWTTLLEVLENSFPKMNILFTVSPVRHTKEGLQDNALSKARLMDTCYELSSGFDNAFYFPSYEIMIDELRDYRYYNDDMIHPSSLAIDYIWKAFGSSFFDKKAQEQVSDIGKLNNAKSHRFLHPESSESNKFRTSMLNKLHVLAPKYKHINFDEYTNYFGS